MQLGRQIISPCVFATFVVCVALAVLNFAPMLMAPILAVVCGFGSWTLLQLTPAVPDKSQCIDPPGQNRA